MPTLGQQKEATCLLCSAVFSKWRYDQRFCCRAHRLLARTRAVRQAHPEMRKQERRDYRAKYPWKEPFFSARNRALKKSLAFDLTYEWCEQNWTGKCTLSGLPFKLGSLHHHPFSPSIDRIDSSKGYTQENCRFICYGVNSMKGVGTDEELFVLVEALHSQNCAPPTLLVVTAFADGLPVQTS